MIAAIAVAIVECSLLPSAAAVLVLPTSNVLRCSHMHEQSAARLAITYQNKINLNHTLVFEPRVTHGQLNY